jgi:hypothetical protein
MYQDVYGELHPKIEVNRHHVFAQSRAIGKVATSFINQRGLVIPMLKTWHNEGDTALHNNVGLLSPPSARMIHRVNEFTADQPSQAVCDRLISIAGYIEDLAFYDGHTGLMREAYRITLNLHEQIPYILGGQVKLVPNTSC